MTYDHLMGEGRRLARAGATVESAAVLEAATLLEPERHEAWMELGLALEALDRVDEALAALRRARDHGAEHYDTWYTLAFVYGRRRPVQGVEAWRALLRRWPDDFRAWHNLGCLLRNFGRLDAALEAFERAQSLDADSPALHFNKGAALERLGRTEDARTAYLRAVALFPAFAPAQAALARLGVQG